MGAGTTVSISGLTVQHGGNVNFAAGINNAGDLTLDSVRVTDNHTIDGYGGGINSDGGSLHIIDSTVDNNSARYSAGIAFGANSSDDTLEIRASLVSGNIARYAGGYSSIGGALGVTSTTTSSPMSIIDSTFSGNKAGNTGAIFLGNNAHLKLVSSTITGNEAFDIHGGINAYLSGSEVTLYNTIVAGNIDRISGGYHSDVYPYLGTFNYDSSNNLIGSIGFSGLNTSTNIIGTASSPRDPRLTALGDYGGPTKTHSLLPDSPALDTGNDVLAISAGLVTDQRGSGRYVGTVDIGANEFSGLIESINPVSWPTVAKDDHAGFGLGWDLANTDRLVLNTDSTNPNAIRWVRFDGFLTNFSGLSATSAADDSASVISIANDGVTYVRRDKFGNQSDYAVSSGNVALLVKSMDRHGVGYAYTYGLNAGAYTIESVSAVRPGQANETTTYNYNTDGRVDSITDPFGRTANLTYDANARLSQIELPAPDPTQPTQRPTYSFTYDTSGFLASVTDADNRTTQYAFSTTQPGELIITYPDGGQERELGQIGNALSMWRSDLAAWQRVLPTFKYKTLFGQSTNQDGYQIDQLGHTTTFTLDANGQVVRSVDPAHQVTTTQRNAAGLPTRVTVTASGDGGVVRDTQYAYNAKNNLTRVDYLDGTYETWSYDSTFSQATEHVDQLGHRTEFAVDSLTGDTTEVRTVVGLDDRQSTEHDDVVTQYDYESDGLVKDVVQLRSDVNGTPQLSSVTQYVYTAVADTTPATSAVGWIASRTAATTRRSPGYCL